jgi:PadR family transcriptional regulator PadR
MIPVSDRYRGMKYDRFRKDLATGTYDLVVLDILHDGPAYAYGIVKAIFQQSRGKIRWHEGTVYHVLHHLQKQGLVTSDWLGPRGSRRRKYYRLTERGRRAWQTHRKEWQDFVAGVNALLKA